MQFTKFSSLENTYNKKLIDKIVYEGLDSGTWMVTSKIHGANFSFWYNGSDFQVASRTQFVDGTFFGCQGVINMHQQNFIDWYHRNYHNGETVVIEEFEKETEINLKLVIDSEWRLFSKTLTGRVTQVVRPVFLEQLDV